MNSLALIAAVLFILNGSASAQIFTSTNQAIKNPANISDFKFKANIKEDHELEGFEYASSSRYPFVCQLRVNKNCSGILCSGSLIGDKWLLTSRYCIEGATEILVVCGNERRGVKYSAKIFSSIQSWPTVASGDYINIAIVQLDQSVVFNKYIKSIRIPSIQDASFDYTSKNITVLNRFQSSRSSFYGNLQSLELKVVSDTSCLVSHSFCSEVTKPEQDFSSGYLGGPAIVKNGNENDTLIGINYEGIRNGYHKNLQVSINITKFIYWIHHISSIGVSDTLFPGECLHSEEKLVSANGQYSYGIEQVIPFMKSSYLTIYKSNPEHFTFCNNAGLSSTGIGKLFLEYRPKPDDGHFTYSIYFGPDAILFLPNNGTASIYLGHVSSNTYVKKFGAGA